MVIEICIGSSCFLKGSQDIIELMQKAIADNGLDAEVALAGSFCTGKCNREGVQVTIDGEVFCGVTKENFKEFFEKNVLKKIKG